MCTIAKNLCVMIDCSRHRTSNHHLVFPGAPILFSVVRGEKTGGGQFCFGFVMYGMPTSPMVNMGSVGHSESKLCNDWFSGNRVGPEIRKSPSPEVTR